MNNLIDHSRTVLGQPEYQFGERKPRYGPVRELRRRGQVFFPQFRHQRVGSLVEKVVLHIVFRLRETFHRVFFLRSTNNTSSCVGTYCSLVVVAKIWQRESEGQASHIRLLRHYTECTHQLLLSPWMEIGRVVLVHLLFIFNIFEQGHDHFLQVVQTFCTSATI